MDEDTVDVLTLLERAYAEAIDVAAKVTPADLSRPTPCTEWDVAALVGHICWATDRLSASAAGEPGPAPGTDLVAGDVPGAVARTLATALERFRRPGALASSCELKIGTVEGKVAARISLLDTYTHRWDLARAIGGDSELDPDLCAAVYDFARATVTDAVRAEAGFAPPVPVPDQAPVADRLLGFLGRRP